MIILENLVVATLASLLIYISFSAMDHDFGMDALNDNHPKVVHAYISAISAGIGIIILLLSLLGLFGSIKKSESALAMYAAIIFFMVTILAIMVIFTLTMQKNGTVYKDVDRSIVNTTIAVYNHSDPTDIKTTVLDQIQKRLSCCGINSPADWKDYGPTRKIAKSCCATQIEASNPFFKYCEQSDYKIGCWKAITDYFHANLSAARTILYILIAFGLTCSLAAFSMLKSLKRSLEVV